MTTPQHNWQSVETNSGHHLRLKSDGNHHNIVISEVYTDAESVWEAFVTVGESFGVDVGAAGFALEPVDERRDEEAIINPAGVDLTESQPSTQPPANVPEFPSAYPEPEDQG
jgi:hypothetical protein